MGRVPEVFYRSRVGEHYGPWTSCLEKPKRNFGHLFVNAKGNLYLAYQTQIEKMLEDSQKSKDLERETSFLLIKNLVRQKVIQDLTHASHFEFKVVVTFVDGPVPISKEVLITPEYEVRS